MASRPLASPQLVATNASMATTITSLPTITQNLSMISYDISWTGATSPTGVMSVQVSNTYSQNADGSVANAGNWTTLTLSSTPTVSGSSGNGFIDVDATAAYAVRCVYTPSAGTGTMNIVVAGKVQ